MKKTKLLTLLAFATLLLTACGTTENIKPEEAVEKALPQLVKTSVDTYEESGCLTISSKLNSLNVEVSSGDYLVKAEVAGNVTLGLRNMYTTNIDELQMGAVFDKCAVKVNIDGPEDKDYDFKLENFSFGAYLSTGNLYIDISNASLIDSLSKVVSDVLSNEIVQTTILSFLDKSTLEYKIVEGIFNAGVTPENVKTLLGEGKYRIDNVIEQKNLPLYKKGGITLEDITKATKDIFGYINDEDLAKIMTLVHNKNEGTYDLSFNVKDPAVVNNIYKNTGAEEYTSNCTAVDLKFEALTDAKGAFSSVTSKGSTTFTTGEGEKSATVKVNEDLQVGFDFTKYSIVNPSFSDFKSNFVMNLLASIIKGLIPNSNTGPLAE